jgi:hypothetical protein
MLIGEAVHYAISNEIMAFIRIMFFNLSSLTKDEIEIIKKNVSFSNNLHSLMPLDDWKAQHALFTQEVKDILKKTVKKQQMIISKEKNDINRKDKYFVCFH